jgi:protein SCO1/2
VKKRLVVLASLAALCAACGSASKVSTPTTTSVSRTFGFSITPVQSAPGFTLADQNGTPTGPQDARGHWLVVTFLYTHCPDVCPLIASQLGSAMRHDADLRVLAVSVDPKRDTRAAVVAFLRARNLPARFRYVIGTRPQLAAVWRKYHIAATPGPQGTVSHSTFELLVDPRGKVRLIYDSQITAAHLLHDLRVLRG